MTEDDVVRVMDDVVSKLAVKFQFGYFDVEDIAQEARLEAWKGLVKYDGIRPLANFLWVHIHNRLCNLKRNKYQRLQTPCSVCAKNIDGSCIIHENCDDCLVYGRWVKRNTAKKNLVAPVGIDYVDDESEKHMRIEPSTLDGLCCMELCNVIDLHLPVSMRKDYLRLKSGLRLSRQRKIEVQDTIRGILDIYYD